MSFAFDDYLRAGVAAGLSPEQVWASSLRDLRALGASSGRHAGVVDRDAFDALCSLFPDGDD